MQTIAQVDMSRFERRLAAVAAARPLARRAVLTATVDAFVGRMNTAAPRDTRRYIAAWQEAANKSGLVSVAVEPVRESRVRALIIARLTAQLENFRDGAERYAALEQKYRDEDAAAPRLTKRGKRRKRRTSQRYFRVIVARKKYYQDQADRAQKSLEDALGDEAALIFDAPVLVRPEFLAQRRLRRRTLQTAQELAAGAGYRSEVRASVRVGRPGGDAVLTVGATRTEVRLINREPHARIVEASPRFGKPRATALAAARAAVPAARAAARATLREAWRRA